ncbi:MAG: T9SS type A sorting domain-containing protein [Bacteroidia bacterium]|nr:T9SS type A sorting domain-containing protein [Bacteroidia bacterium]
MKSLLTSFLFCFVSALGLSNGHTVKITSSKPLCTGGCNGWAMAEAIGGTGPFGYSWSNGLKNPYISNLCSGSYTCVVTDSSDMSTASATVLLTNPLPFTVVLTTVNATCRNRSDASINASINGGDTGTYNFYWSNYVSEKLNDSLFPGTYTVTVSSPTGCYATSTATVTATSISNNFTSTSSTCSGSTGSITAIATGGIEPYTYSWSNGIASQTNTNLIAGFYTVTITDANACTAIFQTSLGDSSAILVTAGAVQNIYCIGGSVGSATFTASGGTAPYSFLWNTGVVGQTANNLSTGTYSVIVTDSSGCKGTGNISIAEFDSLKIKVNTTMAFCGPCNGTASIIATGGLGLYTYSWSNGWKESSDTLLAPGSYTVTITDANGCSKTTAFLIQSMLSAHISISVYNNDCGDHSGKAVVELSAWGGASKNIVYIWSTGVAGRTADNLKAGSYTVSVMDDDNGCIAVTSVIITSPFPTISNVMVTNAICGGNDGTASVTASGSPYPYKYSWSNGSTSQQITGLKAGTYTVSIVDSDFWGNDLCQKTEVALISNMGGPNVIIKSDNGICPGNTQGWAKATVNGAFGPYSFLWSNGSTSDSIYNLTKGLYIVTVTDNNNCKTIKSVQINIPDFDIDMSSAESAWSACNGKIKLGGVTGGTPPYSYLWTPSNITGDSAYNLCPGQNNYTVTVTDKNGCTSTKSTSVMWMKGRTLSGRVYVDSNKNCKYDIGEILIKGGYLSTSKGGNALTDSNGVYRIYNLPYDTFELSLNTNAGSINKWLSYACPISGKQTITPYCRLRNRDFALSLPPKISDIGCTLYSGPAKPGSTQEYTVCYFNNGTDTVSGTLRITYDSSLVFNSASIIPDRKGTPFIEWTFENNFPRGYKCITFKLDVPAGTPIGKKLVSTAEVLPLAGDTLPSNNISVDIRFVQGAILSNHKEVQPTGDILATDKNLKYTIYFNNNGTDTAQTIIIKDLLSNYLDVATFKPGASSHPYSVQLLNNIAIFTFYAINLPDSSSDKQGSMGWVSFTIDQKQGNSIGNIIENQADIWFDKTPLTTNKTINTIVNVVSVPNLAANVNVSFSVFPNPSSGSFTIKSESAIKKCAVVDVLGNIVFKGENMQAGTTTISLSHLSNGIYFLKITDIHDKEMVSKIVIEH